VSDIRELLRRWGLQRSVDSAYHIDYPHRAAFVSQMRQSGAATVKLPPLDDDTHGRLNAAIGALKLRSEPVRDDYRYAVLVLYYRGDDALGDDKRPMHSEKDIARRLKISRSAVHTARIAAESWVDAMLDTVNTMV